MVVIIIVVVLIVVVFGIVGIWRFVNKDSPANREKDYEMGATDTERGIANSARSGKSGGNKSNTMK